MLKIDAHSEIQEGLKSGVPYIFSPSAKKLNLPSRLGL